MEDNELIWRTLEQERFDAQLGLIWGRACEVVENYGLGKSEATLSNTQLQALARMSVTMPGMSSFNVRKGSNSLNVYELRITRFIRHQAEKSKKPNQGYRKLANGVELGKALCSYLWYDAQARDDLSRMAKEDIYDSVGQFMNERGFPIPSYANPNIIYARLVQEFIGHMVDLARIKRKG